jgi:ligand-binding sensor domain-containing protein/serine phosphatase RsbU (regulator of sigma subunit)
MARNLVCAALAVLAADGSALAKGPAKSATAATAAPAATRATGDLATVQHLAPSLGCDRLTVADGLPNSQVHAIVQDRRGFLWFGTQNGLARYDGTLRSYQSVEKDPNSLSSMDITALTLDPSGGVWIGTDEGVNLYDPNTDQFTRFTRDGKAGLSSNGVAAIARDPKGRMWFAMSGGGLNRFDPASQTFIKYVTKPLDVAVTALTADAAGNLWLGTAEDGLLRWNPDDNSVSRPLAESDQAMDGAPIKAVLVTSDGKVWIGNDGEGVLAFEPKTGKVVRYRSELNNPGTLSDDHITALFEDKSKHLWIGTASGLNQLDPSGRMVRYQHNPNDPTSLSFNAVESIYQDEGGVIWVGGLTIGLCKFDELRLKFGHHRTRQNTSAIFEDPDGTLWAGTYNDGLYKYERGAQRVTIYHELRQDAGSGEGGSISLQSAAWITALYRDRRNTLWISVQSQGLLAFDTRTETYRRYAPDPDAPASRPVDAVFAIWEDDKGMLWLATWGSGLVRFDPQRETFTSFTSTDDANSLSSNHLYTLYPDPADKNVLWLGTGKGGLVRFDTAAGTATSFRNRHDDPASLSNDNVTTIYREPSGIVWAGTFGGGLNRLDPATGNVERFTASNSGLPNDSVLGVLPDDRGHLWLSTNGRGLADFDPKARTFQVYESSDGIQDNEFNQGSFLRSKSGELFFGGAGGFNAFFPRDIKRDPYVPPVVLTAFKIFNQEVKLDPPIWKLPPLKISYADSFEVQFAALAFAAPSKNRYAYKLDGFDDKFIETNRPSATYTKLDGGRYTLRVRASNRHGVWNEIALDLAVAPPWWRTWYAYGAYLIVLISAALALFRVQQQRVRRAEREGRLAVVERDLALTGAVQTGFLPARNAIATEHLQLVGFYRPADACGGDWWWHQLLSGNRHVIMVGDVTGHGPGPAMVTAAVATAFRVLIENGLDNVSHALELLNREVLRVANGKYHMTMAALEIDETTGQWILYNAGAPPILSLGRDGKSRVHFCAGAPLGMAAGFETGRVEGKLEPSDRIILCTDGIPEIELPDGKIIGNRRFAQMYEHTRGHDLHSAAAMMAQQAEQSLGGRPQLDDWTFAMIEWR